MQQVVNYSELRSKLSYELRKLNKLVETEDFDLIITNSEVNERHGTGVFLKRIFSGDNNRIISIRSRNLYDGTQSFGKHIIQFHAIDLSYTEILLRLQQELGTLRPNRILAIPYFPEDFLITIAAQELFNIPLCTYIMDDQNICCSEVSDDLVQRILNRSKICLGISPQLCNAYSQKYNVPFWFVPPVVDKKIISQKINLPSEEFLFSQRGILIGNIWGQAWLDNLRKMTKNLGINIDWYGKPNRDWVKFEEEDLQKDGIFFRGFLEDESDLIRKLKEYPYALVPTGGGTKENDDRPEITTFSLPSRILFILASSHTPILVLGGEHSGAANFVESFGIGVCCDYDTNHFRQTLSHICHLDTQKKIRAKSCELAQKLTFDNLSEWIWKSLEKGKPVDLGFEFLAGRSLQNSSVVITSNEMNYRHGTGALIKRVFPDSRGILSIRSYNHYESEHDFGEVSIHLPQHGLSRPETFQNVLTALTCFTVGRVLCVPYNPDELQTAIAIKELFKVPLATWIMDDQNICVNNIPDDLMQEFLGKCSVRFATHPELRDAYEQKYGFKFWILPAVAPSQYLELAIQTPQPELTRSQMGVLIGNIWSKQWFDMLCHAVGGAGKSLDWYGDYRAYYWMCLSETEIQKRGLNPQGLYPEAELVQKLKSYCYIIVPTGTIDERDDHPELSTLSLPGRTIFAMVTANLPVIVLGSIKTSIAHFVNHFQIGVVSAYDPQSFTEAVDYVMQPDVQQAIRSRTVAIAERFCDYDIGDWVWESLELGKPADDRFEELFDY
jgi:hypothetical protein